MRCVQIINQSIKENFFMKLLDVCFLFFRLKVNNSEEVLVVPLEVEVSSSAGLYCPDDVIDFGIGGSQDPPKQMKLMLRNSWKKPIRVQVC